MMRKFDDEVQFSTKKTIQSIDDLHSYENFTRRFSLSSFDDNRSFVSCPGRVSRSVSEQSVDVQASRDRWNFGNGSVFSRFRSHEPSILEECASHGDMPKKSGFLSGLKLKLMSSLEEELNVESKAVIIKRAKMAKKVLITKLEIESLKSRLQVLREFESKCSIETLNEIELIQQEIEHRKKIHKKHADELDKINKGKSLQEIIKSDLELSRFYEESRQMFLEQDEIFRDLYRVREQTQEKNVGCVSSGNRVCFLGSNSDIFDENLNDSPRLSFASTKDCTFSVSRLA